MKTYKTIKELPKIPVGTEFKYGGTGVVANIILQGECTFLANYFGIDCEFFEEVVPKSYKRWRSKEGGEYIFVDVSGYTSVSSEDMTTYDDDRYNLGNYYQTEEEAEFARDRQIFITKVNDRILELNGGIIGDAFIALNEDGEMYICYQDGNTYPLAFRGIASLEVGEIIIKEFKGYLLKYIFN